MTTTTELTDNERAALAREVAADGVDKSLSILDVECPECEERFEWCPALGDDQLRKAFTDGWDAAMEYVGKESVRGYCAS
jgi:antirestriction protein